MAKSYNHVAEIYRERSLPPGLDPASAGEMKNHYEPLTETEKKVAEAAA